MLPKGVYGKTNNARPYDWEGKAAKPLSENMLSEYIPLRKLASFAGGYDRCFLQGFWKQGGSLLSGLVLENQSRLRRLEEQYSTEYIRPLDCIWQIGLFLLSEYETNSRWWIFLFSVLRERIECLPKGKLLEIGNKIGGLSDRLPIESQKEKKILCSSRYLYHRLIFYCQRFGAFGWGSLSLNVQWFTRRLQTWLKISLFMHIPMIKALTMLF